MLFASSISLMSLLVFQSMNISTTDWAGRMPDSIALNSLSLYDSMIMVLVSAFAVAHCYRCGQPAQ